MKSFLNELKTIHRTAIAFLFSIYALLSPYISAGQINRTGNLTSFVDSVISAMPGAGSNTYQPPSGAVLSDVETTVQQILTANYTSAASNAGNIGYQLIHFTDNTGGLYSDFYVLCKTAASTNFWGTYIFNQNSAINNLILQAPHPKFDSNTGSQAFYVFKNSGARAFCMSGTHRCNQSAFSTCSGTTTACGSDEPYRISDMAHNINSVFFRITQTLFYSITNSVFIQLHGFAKQPADPYVIMSNGTNKIPVTDYVMQLKNQLLITDNTLTFKIAHVDTGWTKLNGLTNVEGRLINQSINICNNNSAQSSGRFIHIEQEYSKLRQNQTGWNKMLQAVINVFGSSPLALELKSFTAKCDDQKVIINCTADFKNVSKITFQKSTDGKTYNDLQSFSTQHLQNKSASFSTYDLVVDALTMYYRIKETGINGEVQFSKPITKTCFTNAFICYYDAASQTIKVNLSHLIQTCRIEIFDDNGNRLFEQQLFNQASVQADASRFNMGIYFIRLSNSEFSEGKKLQIMK